MGNDGCKEIKTAFVKHPHEENLTWETMRFPGAEALLEAFPFRSLGFCLAVELGADFWIVESDMHNQGPRAVREDPAGLKRLRAAQKGIVQQDAVPWNKYDVIISFDPLIDKGIIQAHPNVLWAYREIASRCGRARNAWERGPRGGYDLFLDYYFGLDRLLERLPQTLGFPYMQNPKLLRTLIRPAHEPAVFIDTRHVPLDERKKNEMAAEFRELSGVPLKHVTIEGRATNPVRFFTELTLGRVPPMAEYLRLMGSCKYFMIWRGGHRGEWNITGESALEAAAMGSIVIANENSATHQGICHPFCLIPPGGPPRIGLRKIQKIEADNDLQKEILAHQDEVIWSKHWHKPFTVLKKALEMKR